MRVLLIVMCKMCIAVDLYDCTLQLLAVTGL